LIRGVSAAPGESQFRVAVVKKPFSYYVPFTRFGSLEGIWDADGRNLYTLADRNLRETDPTPPAVAAAQPTGQTRTGGRRGTGQAQAAAQAPAQQPVPPDPTDPTNPDPNPDPGAPRRFGPPADPDGKRDIAWRPDGAGLTFLQLEPAKKDEKEPRKDRVL